LTGIVEQLKDLQLGELLDTPPPGVDEAVAISKVWQPAVGWVVTRSIGSGGVGLIVGILRLRLRLSQPLVLVPPALYAGDCTLIVQSAV
jgi:hypothetical protein